MSENRLSEAVVAGLEHDHELMGAILPERERGSEDEAIKEPAGLMSDSLSKRSPMVHGSLTGLAGTWSTLLASEVS